MLCISLTILLYLVIASLRSLFHVIARNEACFITSLRACEACFTSLRGTKLVSRHCELAKQSRIKIRTLDCFVPRNDVFHRRNGVFLRRNDVFRRRNDVFHCHYDGNSPNVSSIFQLFNI